MRASALSASEVRWDIETPQGLLEFMAQSLNRGKGIGTKMDCGTRRRIAAEARGVTGEVIIGQNVRFGENVKIDRAGNYRRQCRARR